MRHKKYKMSVKKVKNSENEVVSMGFPSTVFEALKKDFAIQDFESCNLKLKTLFKKQPNVLYNYGYFTSNLHIYKIKNNEI